MVNGCELIKSLSITQNIFFIFKKTSKNSEFSIKINSLLNEQSDSIKYLGVVLNINWIQHNIWVLWNLNCLRVFILCENWDTI